LPRCRLPDGCTPENTRFGPEYSAGFCSDMRGAVPVLIASRQAVRPLITLNGSAFPAISEYAALLLSDVIPR
jgi:hypothetical protein